MSAPLHVVRAGAGPLVVLVHGSATDHTTWTIQLANQALRETVRLVAYDRRGATRSPLADGQAPLSVEAHAADLAALVAAERVGDEPVVVIGSSFGGVVALELARQGAPGLAGLVLMEPPLPPSDDDPAYAARQDAFLVELDRLATAEGAGAASELFLRTVLGEVAWGRLPRMFQERSKAFWPQLRGDCGALAAYQVRYDELGAVQVPTRVLCGDRSAPYFRPTVEALVAALGAARMEVVPAAGHMMQAEAPKGFHERVLRFVGEVVGAG